MQQSKKQNKNKLYIHTSRTTAAKVTTTTRSQHAGNDDDCILLRKEPNHSKNIDRSMYVHLYHNFIVGM